MSHVTLRLVRTALTATAIALVAAGAHAQDGTKAASVLAYDEAERLMAEGKLADACLKYAESERLDPQLGTLLHLADCLEKNGQTASAWASFREAAEVAEKRNDPRRETAEQRIANLIPRLSKLQIEVPAGTDPTTLQIKRGNVVVGSALWGAPVPTDPGPHTITASAPGLRSWTGNVIVKADGSTTVVKVPALEAEVPKSPETSATPTQTATTPENAQSDTTPQTDGPSSSGRRIWPALVAGGVGLVGIGVGTAFGLISKGKGEDADAFCDGTACTDQRGVTLKDDAISAGNVSTVAFIVGGVGLAAGAVLWFTAPSESPAAASRGRARWRRSDGHCGALGVVMKRSGAFVLLSLCGACNTLLGNEEGVLTAPGGPTGGTSGSAGSATSGGSAGSTGSAGTGGSASGGSAGSAGANPSGGSAGTSMAGSSGSAGANPSGGSAGSSSLPPGIALTPMDGWVSRTSNVLGIQGAMFAYADTFSAVGMTSDFVGSDKACMSGSAAKVEMPCTIVAPATDCYGTYWGAAIGFNLNQELDPNTMMGDTPLPYDASALSGFAFEISGDTVPDLLRFKVEDATSEYCNLAATNPISTGPNVVLFSDLRTQCWAATPGVSGETAKPAVLKITWQVVTNANTPVPFDFCITNLRALE